MADDSRISGALPGPIQPPPSDRGPYTHARGREGRTGSSVIDGRQEAANQRSLNRLAKHLASGEPPETDVPRGYYLDIVI